MTKQKVLVALALGSNLGRRKEQLSEAIKLLHQEVGAIASLSSFIETAPEGFASTNPFLNAALVLSTALSPEELLEKTEDIERRLGRVAKHSKGTPYTDRAIDIDILLYNTSLVYESPRLAIPHPEMHRRRFVLEPLASLIPTAVHPRLNKTISLLLGSLS